ncbi:MAG: NUDIX hydrolase [DPANN group archaeon]|nr:NUDIX hydrolase [DPANN group archaeon]
MRGRPAVTDIILEFEGKLALIKRGTEPYKGTYALPGGYVNDGETIEQAAIREMKEETGLDIKVKYILGVYSNPERDRRKNISTVFICEKTGGEPKAGSDAKEIHTMPLSKIDFSQIAFDHDQIIQDYIKWKKEKGTYWSTKQ